MIEFDDDGKEWFGYSSGGETEPAAAVADFTGNVQYVE